MNVESLVEPTISEEPSDTDIALLLWPSPRSKIKDRTMLEPCFCCNGRERFDPRRRKVD